MGLMEQLMAGLAEILPEPRRELVVAVPGILFGAVGEHWRRRARAGFYDDPAGVVGVAAAVTTGR